MYRRLATRIENQIIKGSWRAGDKMPSLRQFSQQHSVSMTTTLRCFEHLEARGLIQAKERSGYFVTRPVAAKSKLHFPKFEAKVTTLGEKQFTGSQASSSEVQPFMSAQLSPDLLPTQMLQRSLTRSIRQQPASGLGYGDPQGSIELRTSLSRHFSDQGFPFEAEQLIISNGCIDAVALAIETVSAPGDCIVVPSPCFNGLLQLLASMKRKVIELPSTAEGINLFQLERLAKQGNIKACLLTANFQNPTGHSLSVAQKKRLAALANHYKLPIIEDDVYCELGHASVMPLPIKAWDKNGWVLWCGSVSKSLAPGLRIGWCLAGRFHQAYLSLRYTRTLGINQPLQCGLAEFINIGEYAKHLSKIRVSLGEHVAQYQRLLQRHLPDSAEISAPAGGMVLWAKVKGLDSVEMQSKLHQQDILIRSGALFSTHSLYNECFRINIGWALDDKLEVKLRSVINACLDNTQ